MIDFIFYIMYARLLLEAHETMALSSAGEMKENQADSTSSAASTFFSWAFFIFAFTIPSFALYLFYSNRRRYDPEKKQISTEFFAGLKNTKWARFYAPSLLFRRIFFVCIIIFMAGEVDRLFPYLLLILTQMGYAIFLLIVRPYETTMDNLIDIVNESFLVAIIIYLLAMNNGSKWTDSSISVFMNILTINSLAVVLIMMGFLIKDIILKCALRRRNKIKAKQAKETEKVDVKTTKHNLNKKETLDGIPKTYRKEMNPYAQNETHEESNRTQMKSMESSRRVILPKLPQRHIPKSRNH